MEACHSDLRQNKNRISNEEIFGSPERTLVFVHGPNEAGKTTTLRAISDLRFGIHAQSRDNFVHDYPKMRLGGNAAMARERSMNCCAARATRIPCNS